MRTISLLISHLLITNAAFSQDFGTSQNNKQEVVKLAFMVGTWKGTGWILGQDGQKHLFDQTETASFKLDSTALMFEGLGISNGKVAHNAMAIVTYNKTDNNYSFHSYLANGRENKFKAQLIDRKFYWYPSENMRYVIFLNNKGQWHETGEVKKGEQWILFFEMTLDKI